MSGVVDALLNSPDPEEDAAMTSAPMTALNEILDAAGLSATAGSAVHLIGDDPVFPTRYRIGAAGAAVIAATGVAAGKLWELRTGRAQDVLVSVRAAAAALRSVRYMKLDGPAQQDPIDPFTGFYPTAGGRWVYLHCNFPNHRDSALSVAGVTSGTKEDLIAAVVRWDGPALEEALMNAGGCASLTRSEQEWMQHPQAAAIKTLPLLEIVRIGDAPVQPIPDGARPLSGIRVLDFTRVLAGPTCARTLAEHGADVLKITAPHLPHSGWLEFDTGLGKLSAYLDLRDSKDIAKLRELVKTADVFSQSYRPGALEHHGFGPAELAALRPGIICVELSAWGREGPWHSRRGFDTIVQTATGMAMVSGDGSKPQLMPVSAIDYVSGYLMAFGAMVALARRALQGGSWLVRVSLASTGRWIVDRGLLDRAALSDIPNDLPPEEINQLLSETNTPVGRLRHLAPVAQMSETKAYWARPPVPLGTHPPRWA
jgi:crotonobetainyl-CoA:carnitine CoA-transferase CaiB-like acyl-CoA transferase